MARTSAARILKDERTIVLTDFFNKYYILNRSKYLRYVLSSDKTKLRASTFDCDKLNRPYYLSDSLLAKHFAGAELLGVCFADKTTKFLGLDLDTCNKRDLARLLLLLYEIGINDSNMLVSKSGSKGYHVDILFNVFLYRDKAQKLFEYIKNTLNFSYLEARGGTSDSGYKLPFGTHFVACKNVYLCAYTSNLEEVNQADEVELIKSKIGLTTVNLNNIFSKAKLGIRSNRNLSADELKSSRILKALKKANEIVIKNNVIITKNNQNTTSSILIEQKKNQRPGNLIFTYRMLAEERASDMKILVSLRKGDFENMRNKLLYCYAIVLKGTFITKEKLTAALKELNNTFIDPIQTNEIQTIVKHSFERNKNQWKTETIINWLDITQQEMQYMTTLTTESRASRKLEKRKQARKEKKELKLGTELQQIKDLIDEGFTNKDIQERLNISKSTLMRRKRELEAWNNKGIEEQLLTPPKQSGIATVEGLRFKDEDFYQISIFDTIAGNAEPYCSPENLFFRSKCDLLPDNTA